jgi:hypothetical protein
MSLAQQSRVMAAVQADHERTEDLAVSVWRSVQSLSACPQDCLSRNRVALIEARDALQRLIDATRPNPMTQED